MSSTKTTTTQELRKFGLMVGAVFISLFGLLLPWLKSKPHPLWPFLVGGPLLTLGVILPIALKPLYVVWMKIGLILGWINTRIILSLLFFLVFTPVGFLMRLFKKDPLHLSFNKDALTYWSSLDAENTQQLDRPF